jgi:hypothetical protein
MKVVADRVNPRKFYAYDAANGIVYASTDGGASFTVATNGVPTVRDWTLIPPSVKTVFGNEGHLWLTTGSGLYRSTNSGASFVPINSVAGASQVSFGKAAPAQNYPAVFIVGTIGGVYGFFRSDDQGAAWTRVNDDQHQYGSIWSLAGDPKVYGRVYVGTSGRGIICGDIQTPVPQIQPFFLNRTNLAMQIRSESGIDYVLQQAAGLTPPVGWRDLSTNAGTGCALNITVPFSPVTPQQFFRLRCQAPH